jgi:thiamine-phosphate pyrophosphorylase
MRLPRLHVVTDDAVLASPAFVRTARALLERGGGLLALHLRGHGTPAAQLHGHAVALRAAARAAGAWLVINDRIDVALAVAADAVQLGGLSLPLEDARPLLPHARIGYSAHGAAEADAAARRGTDFVLLGTIHVTASHTGRPPLGVSELAAAADCGVPVIAIGGITPDRVGGVYAAGAAGVAALGGVWRAADPVAALVAYLAALDAADSEEQ